MEEIIKLDSKGKKFLKKLKRVDGSESKTYVLKLDSAVLRNGYTEEGHKFISPPGGPMIIVGQELQDGIIVKSIDHVEDYGYTITFE